MQIRMIGYDGDGTLFDTWDYVIRCTLDTCQTVGINASKEDVHQGYQHGLGPNEVFAAVAPEEDPEELTSIFYKVDESLGFEGVKLQPGILKALRHLASQDIEVGMVTHRRRASVEKLLVRMGLDGVFGNLGKQIICREDVEAPKPDPQGLRKLAQQVGLTTEASTFIGDTTVDIDTAMNAAATPIGYTGGFGSEAALIKAGAQHIIHRHDDLPELLSRIN